MNKLKNLLIMFHEMNHIAYIDAQINEYEARLNASDNVDKKYRVISCDRFQV